MPVSERLNTIISLVPPDAGVVDVGTDHAVVPIELARINPNRKIIGVEYNLRPYYQAVQKVVQSNLETFVEIRKGYGIDCLSPHEVDVAIIAGLGSATIQEIIRRGNRVAKGLTKLILGPMDYPYKLRQSLLTTGYSLLKEHLVHEFRWYELLEVAPGALNEAVIVPENAVDLAKQIAGVYADRLGFTRLVPLQMLLEMTPILSEDPDKGVGFLREKKEMINRILDNMPEVPKTKQRRYELEAKLQSIWELEDRLCALKTSSN